MPINLPKENMEQKETGNKDIKPVSAMDKINNFLLRFSRVPLKEKLMFVQHLSVMFKAGIPLSSSLRTLSEQSENKLFKKILTQITNDVVSGVSLAESLKPHKKVFGELFINMVESGELSGKLEDVLSQLYIQMKKHHQA